MPFIQYHDATGKRDFLTLTPGKSVVFGRDPECDLPILDDTQISRHHFKLECTSDGAWSISDAGSKNGSFLNGRRLEEGMARLSDGDKLRAGRQTYIFLDAKPAVDSQELSAVDSAAAPSGAEQFKTKEEALAKLEALRARFMSEIGKVVVGQKDVVEHALAALLCRGHCLLVGVPGLAKTLIVKTFSAVLDLDSNRIQFTPDLMPSDIVGTEILEETAEGRRHFRFKFGPVFTNVLLADEINRAPPKTQAALLEAMQERRVTAAGQTYPLPDPFVVLATQNPIEQEGTYPLPEAQLDRFMFCLKVDYPSEAEEIEIITETTRETGWKVEKILDARSLVMLQNFIRQVPASRHVAAYAAKLSRATRPSDPSSPDFVRRWVRWGAGPRAGQFLLLGAKAAAVLDNRLNVSCADVKARACSILRHRILCNFAASSEGVDTDVIVRKLLDTVKEPEY